MAYFKKLEDQVKDFNTFFRDNSVLILVSIVFTILPNLVPKTQRITFGTIAQGMSFFIIIFLMILLLYQIYKIFFNAKLTEVNWIMVIFFSFLILFILSYAADFALSNKLTVTLSSGIVVGSWLAAILSIIFFLVPALIARFIIIKAEGSGSNKTKWTVLTLGFIVMGVAVPLIAYLYRRNVEDILITPIFITTLSGLAIIFSQTKWLKPKEQKAQ